MVMSLKKTCDVVIFTKNEDSFCCTHQSEMLHKIIPGKGDWIKKVIIKYRNSNKNTYHFTTCALCSLF